jgi:flagellar basal-body rod protein FlgF
MDRRIYLSMSGAKATMQRQDVLANNLANVSTNGFREELQSFRAVPVRGDGASTRAYALETTTGYNAESGHVVATGRNLDVAVKGNAWLAVQALDGTEAYTRAGSLDINADGTLVSRGGLPVVGTGGPISVPANAEVSIASDGTISARPPGGVSAPIGKLKLATSEAPLKRGEDGLFRSPTGDLADDPAAQVQDSALESSNVSAVSTMVAMIAAARQFEAQMKSMQTTEKDEQQAQQLLSMN